MVYGTGFTAGSLARIKVGSDKELTEVGLMPQGD